MFTTKPKPLAYTLEVVQACTNPPASVEPSAIHTYPFMWDFFNPLIFMASRLIIKKTFNLRSLRLT